MENDVLTEYAGYCGYMQELLMQLEIKVWLSDHSS